MEEAPQKSNLVLLTNTLLDLKVKKQQTIQTQQKGKTEVVVGPLEIMTSDKEIVSMMDPKLKKGRVIISE